MNADKCYCACHGPAASRPSCLHCKPEQFSEKRDPYCETELDFAKRYAREFAAEQLRKAANKLDAEPKSNEGASWNDNAITHLRQRAAELKG